MIFQGHIFEPEEQENLNIIYNNFLNFFTLHTEKFIFGLGNTSTKNVNLPSQATANWSSSTLRFEESLNFASTSFPQKGVFVNKTFHIYEKTFFSIYSTPKNDFSLINNLKNNIIPNKIKSDISVFREDLPTFFYITFRKFYFWLRRCLRQKCELSSMDKSSEKIKYEISPITEMNEIYLSVPGGKGSDHIFERKHVDGPFFFLPYCYVYRCILGLSYNDTTVTHFEKPFSFFNEKKEKNSLNIKKHQIKGVTVDIYDFVAFDYNRQPHYITSNLSYSSDRSVNKSIKFETKKEKRLFPLPTDKNAPRVVYKLHYIIYPSFLPKPVVYFYKKIHSLYNSIIRTLFVC